MKNNIEDISKLIPKFNFQSKGQVCFHEVDVFQVVHNLNYLFWTEKSRVDYCNHLGIGIVPASNKKMDFSVFLVHSDVTYFAPARFLDKYIVYTRTKKMGYSSMEFEHIVTLENGQILLKNNAVEVYVDKAQNPTEVPADIRNKIINFEKENIILKNETSQQ